MYYITGFSCCCTQYYENDISTKTNKIPLAKEEKNEICGERGYDEGIEGKNDDACCRLFETVSRVLRD